jgi:hypothetical protein
MLSAQVLSKVLVRSTFAQQVSRAERFFAQNEVLVVV